MEEFLSSYYQDISCGYFCVEKKVFEFFSSSYLFTGPFHFIPFVSVFCLDFIFPSSEIDWTVTT